MLKASWMALLSISLLLPAAGFCDDNGSADDANEQQQVETLSTEDLLAQSGYASRWQLAHPIDAVADTVSWQQQMIDFDFQDETALARMTRLRSVSLLTIAEIGPTRLFFGINHDGLVGLHFNPLPRSDDEQDFEMVRMPYLNEHEPDSEIEH